MRLSVLVVACGVLMLTPQLLGQPRAPLVKSKNSHAWALRQCWSPEEVAAFLGELPPRDAEAAKVFVDPRVGSIAVVFPRPGTLARF